MGPEKDSWLFVRGHHAIHVKKLPMGMTLLVCGPGSTEHSHHFDSEASLDEFWYWYRRHLLSEEWVPTLDRRASTGRPAGSERRRRPRPEVTPEPVPVVSRSR